MRLLEVLQSVYQEHLENHSSGKQSGAEMSNFSSCESCVLVYFFGKTLELVLIILMFQFICMFMACVCITIQFCNKTESTQS